MVHSDVSSDKAIAPLARLVASNRVLICVGAGGVGKTTIAASLGVLAARMGRRALVMTIDPARRLAVSLGLEELTHTPREVPLGGIVSTAPNGALHAMVLDQKRTFDEVIARHSPDERTFRRVMGNKLYQELSTRLAGGQEYAAIEKLYDTVQTSSADLLVLDTPPTVNAIDFLEAPRKMVALIDGPAVRLFVRSYEEMGRFSLRVLSIPARYVFKRLARFVGGRFLDDVAAFFADLHSMLGGFRDRAADVAKMLGQPDVGFVIVTSPAPQAVDEAVALRRRLAESSLKPAAHVVNRVHSAQAVGLDEATTVAQLLSAGVADLQARELTPLLIRSHQQMAALAASDTRQIARLLDYRGPAAPYVRVPLLAQDVHDIATLNQVSQHLAR